jgi:excisionase family DNA binding protein
MSEVFMLLFKISKEEKIESNKVLKKDIAKLPPNMAKLLKRLLGDTSNDSEIKVDETLAEYLTPNEAASYLQVSRPYVMKLIADKVLSSHKIGAHNKVHLKDVVALKNSWSNDIKAKSEKIKKGLDRFIQDEGWDE